jgi:hypothetical protein
MAPLKLEGIVLKAEWHWGSDSSVGGYLLGEPGFPCAWGFVDNDCMFFPHLVGGLLLGDYE